MPRRKISNELWVALEPLIPVFAPSPKGGRRRTVDDRAALNGILYVLQTGRPQVCGNNCIWRCFAGCVSTTRLIGNGRVSMPPVLPAPGGP